MIVLDQTIVNVALPSIQDDLGFSQSTLAWVVNAYLITFGGLLLLAGRLGDLIGRKTVFLTGLALFTAASRALRARAEPGDARRRPVPPGRRRRNDLRRDPRDDRDDVPGAAGPGKAIGVYSFVAAAGASIGLLLGGVLTQALSWHWIFFVNLPIGVVDGVAARRAASSGTRESACTRAPTRSGAVLITAALMLGVYTIVEPAADDGWGAPHDAGARRGLAGAAGRVHRP